MGGVRIVETVTATSMGELCRRRDRVRGADLVELRLDGVADADVAAALAGRSTPVIVTCRPRWEGGRFGGSERDRLALLAEAVRRGAEYVDVEWAADWQEVPRGGGTRLILSSHDFEGVPDDLAERVGRMRSARPDLVKVAVTARRLRDCLSLRAAVADAGPHVAIAMGSDGLVTRVCPSHFGSVWTYGGRAAPGQLAVETLADVFRVRQTTTATALYAVTGRPLAHSASPAMHNAAFAASGMDAVYAPLETADAGEFIDVAGALGVRGASVTAPLKRALLASAGAADATSVRVGATNTLRRVGNGWEAANFDLGGFLAPLDRCRLELEACRAVVLGGGGAARAAAAALHDRGAQVAVAARRAEQARVLARDLGVGVDGWPPERAWDLLVNATPVGTWPAVDAVPLDVDPTPGAVVYDLVYNPTETRLVREARARGAVGIGGLDMLVEQAARQFSWWTGRPAPVEAMEAAALAFLADTCRGDDDRDDV